MNSPFASTLAGLALGALALLPMAAQAQDLHDGDIKISVVGGKITVSGNDAWHADGSAVFEGDFGTAANGFITDAPGYDSELGTFSARTIVNYVALGSLQYWNPTAGAWSGTVLGGEYVKVEGNGFPKEDTRWTATGLSGNLTGLLGQASNSGVVHKHLEMMVARPVAGMPAVGAYLIQLQLTADGYGSSSPYYLALNQGLLEEDFEMAVGALAPVPEPETWALMLAGLAATGLVLRRRAG